MFSTEHIEVQSIEELIRVLKPIDASAIHCGQRETAHNELRRMKKNVSALLSFTSQASIAQLQADPELQHAVGELRRECLVINGMISRILLLQWSKANIVAEYISDVLQHYQQLSGVACRMCLITAPQLSNQLAQAL